SLRAGSRVRNPSDRKAAFDEATSNMAPWKTGDRRGEHAGDAGLVLLYADDFASLPPVFVLENDVELIGREPGSASIVIPQRAVSRVHARVERTAEGWTVRDLGSHNGLVVGGRAVAEAVLVPNAEVRVGNALLKFVPDGARAYAAYRIDGHAAPEVSADRLPG